MTIFVSVAAYRDLDLPSTLQDCVAKARHPADLHFGVVWQFQEGEPAPPDVAPAKMSLVKVPWQDSQGACWARAEAMKLWDGEDFFFQIDSHHRFVQDWDVKLLDQAERSGATLPLLTTYAADFSPSAPLPETAAPTAMRYASFTREGVALFDKDYRPDWTAERGPVRASCLSAHLLFTLGRFVSDVPYDPELYFFGEEVTLAIRAFTWGYDLLHPSVHVMWHQNPRRITPTHWHDHIPKRKVAVTAKRRDAASLEKVWRFVCNPQVGPFGCGTARTFAEYERYAGVDFRRRAISLEAGRGDEPPPPPSPIPGEGGLRTWPVRCVIDPSALPPAALDRPAFWYVAFHDQDGQQIARLDANRPELHELLNRPGQPIVLERQVRAYRPPVRWTVWPTDRQRIWLQPIIGEIEVNNVTAPSRSSAPAR
jgi:hypothetical protein